MKISTYIFSIIFTILIIINSVRVSLTYLYYELDPIGFIEVLCENQDKPELQCNGKCHLKKVAESQDENRKTSESITNFKELILYTGTTLVYEFGTNMDEKKQNPIDYKNLYSFIETNDCFHPPRM